MADSRDASCAVAEATSERVPHRSVLPGHLAVGDKPDGRVGCGKALVGAAAHPHECLADVPVRPTVLEPAIAFVAKQARRR